MPWKRDTGKKVSKKNHRMGWDRFTFNYLFAKKCQYGISERLGKLKVTGLIINRTKEIICQKTFCRCWRANIIFN